MSVFLPLLVLFLILGVGPSCAYEKIQIPNGAGISGKVTIEGEKPRPMALNLVTISDPRYGIGRSSDCL